MSCKQNNNLIYTDFDTHDYFKRETLYDYKNKQNNNVYFDDLKCNLSNICFEKTDNVNLNKNYCNILNNDRNYLNENKRCNNIKNNNICNISNLNEDNIDSYNNYVIKHCNNNSKYNLNIKNISNKVHNKAPKGSSFNF